MKILIPFLMGLTLTGCATAVKTYAPDGRLAYNIDCSLTNWGQCRQKAGLTCGAAGYEIIAQDGEEDYSYGSFSNTDVQVDALGASGYSVSSSNGSTVNQRTMTIVCKK